MKEHVMAKSRATKTTAQALHEQQEQAERDRGARSQPLPAVAKATPPTAPDRRTARQRYLDDIAPSGIVGRLAKFDGKAGKFVFVDTDEAIGDGEDFVVLADQTMVAYVKFQPEQGPLRIGGLLYAPDFELPPREQLGDNDKAKWEIGLSGQPDDPWKEEMMLVLKRPATMELLTFSTLNKTGRRAVGNLLKHYDRLQATSPGSFPVVRLKVGGYEDSRYGWVHVPNFVVVGVSPGHTAAIPDTSLKAAMEGDEIPF
jgi:hypothetical protein